MSRGRSGVCHGKPVFACTARAGAAVELGPRPPGAKTFPIEIRAEAIAVFFKTARNADRLIDGVCRPGACHTSSACPASRSSIIESPVDYRHSTDIAAQLLEDVLL